MTALEPDRDQIEQFFDAVFRYRGEEGYLSLRVFEEGSENPLFSKMWTARLTNGATFKALADQAYDLAFRAANNPQPAVFCPSLAVFNAANGWQAREEDLLKGLVLSVECDEHPEEARATLEDLLGEATAVVGSGGLWINGDGEAEDKLHLHWRLATPAQNGFLPLLKEARARATALVGGDPSNVPAVHCLRIPGSWHRKYKPRPCRIVALNPDREIDLDAAFAALKAATPDFKPSTKPHEPGEPQASVERIAAALGVIPNDVDWDGWNNIGMASWRATGGSAAGLAAFDAWSKKSPKYNAGNTAARWAGYFKSPPTQIGAGTIFYLAEQASPGWWQDPPPPPPNPKSGPLGDFDVGERLASGYKPPPRQWVLANQFCLGFISTLFAAGGVGKSALRLLQFISLAIGRSLCGQHIFRQCRVLIISLEDDEDEVMRRIIAVAQHYNIAPTELNGQLRVACPIGMRLAKQGKTRGDRVTGPLKDAILEAVDRFKPDVIGIDPFVKTHELEENIAGDMNYVCDLLVHIAITRKVSVDIPHHVHKGKIEPGDADAGRGSSAVKDAGRLNYTLTVMDEKEAEDFKINPDDRFSYIRLDPAKVNIAGRGGRPEWFRIIGHSIGNETPKFPEYPKGDNIQVVVPWTPPEFKNDLSAATVNRILDVIEAGILGENGPTGERYSAHKNAKDRAVWRVVQQFDPDKTEAHCKKIVEMWMKTGLIYTKNYTSKKRRTDIDGVFVNATKRPGTTCDA